MQENEKEFLTSLIESLKLTADNLNIISKNISDQLVILKNVNYSIENISEIAESILEYIDKKKGN